MTISIPPFSNVPAPGDPLSSAWAQQLTQYAVDYGPIKSVIDQASLPAAASNTGAMRWVIPAGATVGQKVLYVSDGTIWRLVYGDTGRRLLAAGDGATPATWSMAGTDIRRIGNTVWMAGYAPCLTAGALTNTTQNLYLLPVGFRTTSFVVLAGSVQCAGTYYPSMINVNASVANSVVMSFYGGLTGRPAAYAVSDRCVLGITWTTTDSWPTTLPGTASGGVPGRVGDDLNPLPAEADA